jgi:hypothetical protein
LLPLLPPLLRLLRGCGGVSSLLMMGRDSEIWLCISSRENS